MNVRHLIDLNDFTTADWHRIIRLAQEIMEKPQDYYGTCQGKLMATLFYEPSTRTQMSFQAAMHRLGGSVIGFDNPLNSSVSKGESLADTIRIVSGYTHLVTIRHPVEGAAQAASRYSSCPVINAGDGGHIHPTQTLTDLVTLTKYKGTLQNMTIGLCGDLKNGRTVHSILKALSRFPNKFILISTKELALPAYVKDILNASGCPFEEVYSLEEAIPRLDVLYMTRIQKERFSSEEEYERQKNVYVLDRKKLLRARADLAVLHPLPRVDEITPEVDSDPRALYFEQAKCGMYARMALITCLLQDDASRSFKEIPLSHPRNDIKCTNPKCITNHEPSLPHTFRENGGMFICEYCDERMILQ